MDRQTLAASLVLDVIGNTGGPAIHMSNWGFEVGGKKLNKSLVRESRLQMFCSKFLPPTSVSAGNLPNIWSRD
jgi:hypothetical protein